MIRHRYAALLPHHRGSGSFVRCTTTRPLSSSSTPPREPTDSPDSPALPQTEEAAYDSSLLTDAARKKARVKALLRQFDRLNWDARKTLIDRRVYPPSAEVPKWQSDDAAAMQIGPELQGRDRRLVERRVVDRREQEERERGVKKREKGKPAYARRKPVKYKRFQLMGAEEQPAESEAFSDRVALQTLCEDRQKAELYEHITKRLKNQWKTPSAPTDQFFDVMSNAVRDDLMDQSRPKLVNVLADYDNPYMMKRAVLQRILYDHCTRNKLDEEQVENYLDKYRPDLTKLRLEAKMPPEVIEPLMAFRGDVRYHYDSRERLQQKLHAIGAIINELHVKRENGEKVDVDEVLSILPENQPTEE
ncbi:unnamed protein product [Vitrella brassicaformis CCMP3155]|uniref:Ribosomal protein S24/S35 mitochondrial conserved domain-containing protein n=1 Tax=Vitrella brassicaformis (strain CCMP3155) TaxID=1169540 RepID=A0A0G4G7E8_VITBC|nr:unnamed protein product [Vitrella brassicaformis CCMP3155]|eukprot:CEM24551.1 unnamed protein product [Vitrella brassicaformis CCMP3155]